MRKEHHISKASSGPFFTINCCGSHCISFTVEMSSISVLSGLVLVVALFQFAAANPPPAGRNYRRQKTLCLKSHLFLFPRNFFLNSHCQFNFDWSHGHSCIGRIRSAGKELAYIYTSGSVETTFVSLCRNVCRNDLSLSKRSLEMTSGHDLSLSLS